VKEGEVSWYDDVRKRWCDEGRGVVKGIERCDVRAKCGGREQCVVV